MLRVRSAAGTYLTAVVASAVVTIAALYALFRADVSDFATELTRAPGAAVWSSPEIVGLGGIVVAGLVGLLVSVVVLGARAVEPRNQ
jgi:hypothetical protein